MKISSIVIGLIGTGSAILLSKINTLTIMQIWMEILALLTGGFFGVYIPGMFTTRTVTTGAVLELLPVSLRPFTSKAPLMCTGSLTGRRQPSAV